MPAGLENRREKPILPKLIAEEGEMLKIVLAVLLLLVVVAAGSYWFVCPCERIPGGPLSGEVVADPVADWSFVNNSSEVPLCEVQIQAIVPHSVTVNCMSAAEALYVSCSQCAGKYWSSKAVVNPAGQVRAAGLVYPINYRRVTETEELDLVWKARAKKVGLDETTSRPDHWWTFNLTSR